MRMRQSWHHCVLCGRMWAVLSSLLSAQRPGFTQPQPSVPEPPRFRFMGPATNGRASTYERDPATNTITALTVTCPDRTGRPLRHSSLIRGGNEEWIKRDLLQTHCSWRARRGRGAASLGLR
jgi:hypothetical protein